MLGWLWSCSCGVLELTVILGEEEQQAVRELISISPTHSDGSASTVMQQPLNSASDRRLAESDARHAVRERRSDTLGLQVRPIQSRDARMARGQQEVRSASRQIYYWNVATGKVRWDVPAPPSPPPLLPPPPRARPPPPPPPFVARSYTRLHVLVKRTSQAVFQCDQDGVARILSWLLVAARRQALHENLIVLPSPLSVACTFKQVDAAAPAS
jgi:hypothetical protein